jgi:hypothetical protein
VVALRPRARDLQHFPRGRVGVTLPEHPWTFNVEGPERARTAATLLQLDAHALALEGKHGEALRSARAGLNVSRALEDGPSLALQQIRVALFLIALSSAERTMALGDVPDDDLAALQKDLVHEAAGTRLTAALRGERAGTHHVLTMVTAGQLSTAEIGDEGEWSSGLRWLPAFTTRELVRREHAALLRVHAEMVECSRLPAQEQFAAEEAIRHRVEAPTAPLLVRGFTPNIVKVSGAARRAQCQAVAMRALIAAERYRLKHGRWPGKLEDAVPAFLDKVPEDPIDGNPIRYAKWADGVVVYSIGNDRTDDGGDVAEPFKDVGYRLWDREKRRAAPP